MSLIGINMAKIKGILGRFHANGDMKVKKKYLLYHQLFGE